MATLAECLRTLEDLLERVDSMEEEPRNTVFAVLDTVDALHRTALERLAELLGADRLRHLSRLDPRVAWLFEAYSVGLQPFEQAAAALEAVRPYVESHGGQLDLLGVEEGTVRVRLAGSCAGCTSSSRTLREGVEQALRSGFPGFTALEVEQEDAPAHPPPTSTKPKPLLQIGRAPSQG